MSPSKSVSALAPRLSEEEKARLQAMSPSQRFSLSRGYAVVTHRLLDIHNKISGHAQQILVQEIIHATFGAKDNPEWALIKLTHLEARSRYGRKAFEIAADDATERGLIERRKKGRSWLMKVVPEDWESVPDYVPEPAPPLVLVEGGRQRDPATGRFFLPKRGHVAMSELQVADPAQCRFVRVMQTSLPVEVSLEAKDGVISVVISDVSEVALSPPDALKIHRLFASDLTPIFLKLFEKTPDDAMIAKIVESAAGAPPEKLIKRMEEKHRAGVLKSSGLVLELARDVGVAWRAAADERAKNERENAARDQRRAELVAAEPEIAPACRICSDVGFVYELDPRDGAQKRVPCECQRPPRRTP